MRFREFIESTTGGWFDDKENTRPTFVTRQQELPGTSLHLGQNEVQGKVVSRQGTLLRLDTTNGPQNVTLPEDYLDQQERTPRPGDTIRAVLNRDGTCQDCQIIHQSNYPSPLSNGRSEPTVTNQPS
jgi:hypothetical protein